MSENKICEIKDVYLRVPIFPFTIINADNNSERGAASPKQALLVDSKWY
jgi:hypothetical protein